MDLSIMAPNAEQFYPTPEELTEQLLEGIDWNKIDTILEPSAGKGDLADAVIKHRMKFLTKYPYGRYEYEESIRAKFDCIEQDKNLSLILKGKEYRVVGGDFLTFRTYKQYDLIVMNPPFAEGDKHLLKALDMISEGGEVRCVLNAETLRNPYTNTRKLLVSRLSTAGASIRYVQHAFADAERKTDVEVALVTVHIDAPGRESFILDGLKSKTYEEVNEECRDIVGGDFISRIVAGYEMEVEAGIRLIREYKALTPYILNTFKPDEYSHATLNLSVDSSHSDRDLSVNNYVRAVRGKYWTALFENREFTGALTSNMQNDLHDRVRELKDYDFSVYNIMEIQSEIARLTAKGVEDTILAVFDKLSAEHAYFDECSNNIHYYNGWKSNKAHLINKKVVIPINGAFSDYSWSNRSFNDTTVYGLLEDIEKCLYYLQGKPVQSDLAERLRTFAYNGETKKLSCTFFTISLYKKGTCHIEFVNQALLDKLNIYGSRHRGWLPPCYGKKQYNEMTDEEKAVIDEFQGAEAYAKVMNQSDYYLSEPTSSILLLEESH